MGWSPIDTLPGPATEAPVPVVPVPEGWSGAVEAEAVQLIAGGGGLIRLAGSDDRNVTELADGLKVLPRPADRGVCWALHLPLMTVVAAWLEQVDGAGEDSEPAFLYEADQGRGLLGVFDGVGGAGAARIRADNGGPDRTEAYLASRLARQATEAWFKTALQDDPVAPPSAAALHDQLTRRFTATRSQVSPTSSRIAGSLVRALPTTVALSMFVADAGQVTVMPMWAGDSRCHLLTPSGGLQQLTIDDTPEADALSAIVNDAPMTNLVCGDRPFDLHSARFRFPLPVVLVSATDGCFGYVATPAHFEYLVLVSLARSGDAEEWAATMLSEIRRVAGDDASIVVAALGYERFDDLRAAFRARVEWLEQWHLAPFRALGRGDRSALNTLRESSWRRYRAGYERHLPRNLKAQQS